MSIRNVMRCAVGVQFNVCLTLFVTCFALQSTAQKFVSVDSVVHIDRFAIPEWKSNYEVIKLGDSTELEVPYISFRKNEAATVGYAWGTMSLAERRTLNFTLNGEPLILSGKSIASDTALLEIPPMLDDFILEVRRSNNELFDQFKGAVYDFHNVDVFIIPLVRTNLDRAALSKYINNVFGQAQLNVKVNIKPLFKSEFYTNNELLDNPSADHDRFTDRMHEIRDDYFDSHPNANKTAYYVFVVAGFVNDDIEGYSVLNKSVSFVKVGAENLRRAIAHELGASIGALQDTWMGGGPARGSTFNLMDTGKGTRLNHIQWELIHRNCHYYSLYDDYEDVRTSGGLIAYYFWEENNRGEIISKNGKLFAAVKTPFKRNHFSYFQNITNIFFKPLFTVLSYRINSMHFIALILLVFGYVFARKRFFARFKSRSRWIKFGLNFILFLTLLFVCFESFFLVNSGYQLFEMRGGEITTMKNASLNDMKAAITNGIKPDVLAEDRIGSEIFVKKRGKWLLKRRKNVLYFNQYVRAGQIRYKFIKDSDSLVLSTKNFAEKAESHYIVINYLDKKDKRPKQRVFNHLRVEITHKLKLKNPAKRILLFVNGYRPTATGVSFEATFDSIQKKGLENENSNNLIYEVDRYNYWEPWNEINKLFAARINPSDTYYADGHFSVETSNHRNLVDFTTLSQNYPERCKNAKHHACQEYDGDLTYKQFNLEPNVHGIEERKKNGRIAGRNLFQMFNEIPNKSKDDTLFIVAHSMGYAYSLGIIEELRGKINFGGFYIIAPENGISGTLRMSEWEEVWQYGSDFEKYKFKSPCMLDGIAPQTKVGGLSPRNRAFIPENLYEKMGFFDSHFVGYYTWIFDIPKGAVGAIKQR